MYDLITLLNGERVPVQSSALEELTAILASTRVLAEQLQLQLRSGKVDLESATFMMGVAVGALVPERGVGECIERVYGDLVLYDNRAHPTRSLGIYGLADLTYRIDLATPHQREVFKSTKDYFGEMFLLQAGLAVEDDSPGTGSDALALLKAAVDCRAGQYLDNYTLQTLAYEELASFLKSPSRN